MDHREHYQPVRAGNGRERREINAASSTCSWAGTGPRRLLLFMVSPDMVLVPKHCCL